MRAIILVAVAGLIVSTPAFAGDKDPAAKKDDGSKIICKTESYVGSIIPRRMCMTKADWERGESDAREAKDKFDQKGGFKNPVAISGAGG